MFVKLGLSAQRKSRVSEMVLRPRRRRYDNIRTDLKEIWCVHVEWMCLAQVNDERPVL
jgi:hypothetical protein